MTQRLFADNVDPAAYQAVLAMENYVHNSGLDKPLYELIKIRASQINGCAYCLDMHNRDARAGGEDQRRLDVLSAWREAQELFTERECAALALTESVTLIGAAGVPDDVWDAARKHFDDAGMVQLLMAAAVINVWNRLAIATHQQLPQPTSTTAQHEQHAPAELPPVAARPPMVSARRAAVTGSDIPAGEHGVYR